MTDKVQCCDCMDFMAQFPEKFFELAIVDPPYGIGFDNEKEAMVNFSTKKWKNAHGNNYFKKTWDKKPEGAYFDELFRCTNNQIIWGGNYFKLPCSGSWVVWDKIKPEDFSLSQAELAWVSKGNRIAIFKYLWHGFQKQQPEYRIHPTQKPVALYLWLLRNYAKEGDKILDTHMGSQSSRIAAYKLGFDYYGCELDPDYFREGCKRFEKEAMQPMLLRV